MSAWEEYPAGYRQAEVEFLRRAMCAGECAALAGLSGSGKSNLLGFLAARVELPPDCPQPVLIDCNRMAGLQPQDFYRLVADAIGLPAARTEGDALAEIENLLQASLSGGRRVGLLVDRFDVLMEQAWFPSVANNLRALRDRFKYRLVYVAAARRALEEAGELAELFFGHTLWLGPLAEEDALWSARRDFRRYSGRPDSIAQAELEQILRLSGGYPSILRAICEAHAAGVPLEAQALLHSAPVARRLAEFWQDAPSREALENSRLAEHAWLGSMPSELRVANIAHAQDFDLSQLTAKENLLLRYLIDHPGRVCEKDELVQAVWPEDVIFRRGVRDESLAQLVRRLRTKVEDSPENPVHILTSPGRGYIYHA